MFETIYEQRIPFLLNRIVSLTDENIEENLFSEYKLRVSFLGEPIDWANDMFYWNINHLWDSIGKQLFVNLFFCHYFCVCFCKIGIICFNYATNMQQAKYLIFFFFINLFEKQ